MERAQAFKFTPMLAILVAATIASILFWSYFAYIQYTSFQNNFFDIGQMAYSFYYAAHYIPASNWLQYFVFGQHIAVDQLAFLPLFYALPSEMILVVIQAVIVSATSLIIFFIARELLKSEKVAFALGLAYIINPGVFSLLMYDYHSEFLMVPLFLLSFYFYFKRDWRWFLLFLVLLLLSIDTVVPLVAFFGLALLYYETVYNKHSPDRKGMQMALAAIALSILFFIVYMAMQNALLVSYGTGTYNTPRYLEAVPYEALLINHMVGSNVISLPYFSLSSYPIYIYSLTDIGPASNYPFIIYAAFVGILCLIPAILVDPVIVIIMGFPWLSQLLTNHYAYTRIGWQYFSYVTGSAFASAILGLVLMKKGRGPLLRVLKMNKEGRKRLFEKSPLYIVSISMVIALAGGMLGLIYYGSTFTTILFGINQTQNACNSQLNYVIGKIPDNTSLLTQTFITPHTFSREGLETFENYGPYFNADYALVELGNCTSTNYLENASALSNITAFLKSGNYAVYLQNGTAVLYKRN